MLPQFQPASDCSLLLLFGSALSVEGSRRVIRAAQALESVAVPGVTSLSPGYCSLLIRFDPLLVDHADLEAAVRERLEDGASHPEPAERLVELPVCYEAGCAPDLESLAKQHGLSAERVVELHAGSVYRVYFLGFLPGFAYLGEVSEQIATPRMAEPRKSVPAGSVGIAARQTGVYPRESPGGWNLIGRCPLRLFDPGRSPASLLRPGDGVRFRPVSLAEFEQLGSAS